MTANKKPQQCVKCFGRFEQSEGKYKSHQKGSNITPKGTKMEFVCNECRKKFDKEHENFGFNYVNNCLEKKILGEEIPILQGRNIYNKKK